MGGLELLDLENMRDKKRDGRSKSKKNMKRISVLATSLINATFQTYGFEESLLVTAKT